MAVYQLSAFPKQLALASGAPMTVRPMVPEDARALLAFFRHVPDEERYFLKDDVVAEQVVNRWANDLDYDRALPFLAFDGDRICADALLIRHRGDARSHYAEIRIVVDPDYRQRGLGTALLRELLDIAWDAEIESVQGEFIRGVQEDALMAIRALGGHEVATISDGVRDRNNHPLDIVILRVPLGRAWQWSRY